MRFIKDIFDDRMMRTAGVLFVLIILLMIFIWLSDYPEQHPFIGVFIYGLVPIFVISGGTIFLITIFKELREKDKKP